MEHFQSIHKVMSFLLYSPRMKKINQFQQYQLNFYLNYDLLDFEIQHVSQILE